MHYAILSSYGRGTNHQVGAKGDHKVTSVILCTCKYNGRTECSFPSELSFSHHRGRGSSPLLPSILVSITITIGGKYGKHFLVNWN
jgi:hypothetical protein